MDIFKREILAIKQLKFESENIFKKEAKKLFNKALNIMLKHPGIELWVDVVGHVDHISIRNRCKGEVTIRALPFNDGYPDYIENHIKEMSDEFKQANLRIDEAVRMYKEGARFK